MLRKRLKPLKPIRLRVKPQTRIARATYNTRPQAYLAHRYQYLNDIRALRAKRRVHGMNVTAEIKKVQRALVKIRRELS